jgi:malonyl-CoA/methylmalonyl-CoA synthetase
MAACLYDHFARRAPSSGKVFIETPDGRKVTYGDLAKGSARIANVLATRGVVAGDRVAVQVDKSPDAILLYLACLRAGAAFLPLNTAYTPAEIAYFLGDARPRVFVCEPQNRDKLLAVAQSAGVCHVETLGMREDGSLMEAAQAASDTFDDVPRGPDDLAAILYTSGTTGRSKGAMLSHDNLASNALTLADYWRVTQNDVLIHALPIYHTHGLFVAMNSMLLAGGSMFFLPKLDPDLMLQLMSRGATMMMGVPTFYTRLLQHPGLTTEATKNMRLFVSGSAPLLAETHREWTQRTGHAILERYGMTETNMNTSNPYEGDRVPGSVGFPLPGISVRIAHPETAAILPQGEIGMIEVKGPNVFKGYWNMPEKTAAEFRGDGFFITGDLGKIDARGYVSIVGRDKDLVITGGFNVYPIEVETEIDALPGVIESAVVGVPHPDFGEGVTALIVPRKGADISESQVIAALETRLAKFKLPKRVVFVDELPRNAMGKVQKAAIRATYSDLYKK